MINMAYTWIYTLINIAVSISMISEIMCKEYYCTKATGWKDAMETCFASGGSPVSYKNMMDNATGLRLKQNTTVWTGDYIRMETITGDVPREAADLECGYMKFTTKDNYWYYSQDGIQYTKCSSMKGFFCQSSGSRNLVRRSPLIWIYANRACSGRYELWEGSTFETKSNYKGVELWVRSVRIYTFVSANGSDDIQNVSLANCGTNSNHVRREEKNNCDGPLEAVCAFETAIVDPKFSRSCFEDIPESTESPTTSTSASNEGIDIPESTESPTTSTSASTEGTDQTEESKTAVIVASVLTVVVVCVAIGMLLLFLFKRRRRKHVQEKLSDTSYANGHISSIDVLHTSVYHSSETSDKRTSDNVYYNAVDDVVEYANAGDVGDVYEAFGNGEIQGNGKCVQGYINTNDIQRLNPRDLKPYEIRHIADYTDAHVAISEYPPIVGAIDKRHGTNGLISSVANSTSFARSNDAVSEVSEYDTTRNVKRVQETDNIYNHLHCDANDDVYDNKYTKETKHSDLQTENMYSTTSVREWNNNSLQNTEPVYDVGMSNSINHLRAPTDNVYSKMSMQNGGISNRSLKSIDSIYDIGMSKNKNHFQGPTDNLYSTTSMKEENEYSSVGTETMYEL